VSVTIGTQLNAQKPDPAWRFDRDLHCEAVDQLRAYFEGTLREFDLPLVLEGTPFQERVWRALADIPYGKTISYSELAAVIGNPSAVRAVGAANGKNPIPIVLPCHRVIGRDGKLTGYAGGLDIKAALLAFERSSGGLPLWNQNGSMAGAGKREVRR
jgi:methylated-DNA-[protein]-cysteine S-methyltransferase